MLTSLDLPEKQVSLQLPSPLSDAQLCWLGAHNSPFVFEQTASGLLIMTPPTGSRGNRGEIALITQLTLWNDRVNFGEIRGIAGGVSLPQGGQYQADGFVIPAAAWNAIPETRRDDGFPPALPTAVFELISPANLTAAGYNKAFALKLEDYERSAIPLVVLLHPKTQHTLVKRPPFCDNEMTTDKLLTFAELPGLTLDVAKIYTECNRP